MKYNGLKESEVIESRKLYGTNEMEKKKKVTLLTRLLHVFKEPMFLLLIIASLIYFLLGEFGDGIIMIISVVSMICIETFQETKTDKAIEELNILSSLNVKVIREGKEEIIDSHDIVMGDYIILEEGDKVSADGDILECNGLGVDESSLTGESAIVYKKTKDTSDEHFKKNVCYAGTNVTNGMAIIKVTAIGNNTEYGKIGKALNDINNEETPLEKQIRKLVIFCTIFSLTFCIAVFVINFIHTREITTSILSGITVAMATIPEEIPVILTVFLAMGAWNLAKHNTLTRNMKSVETLGAITTLCVDKTGTLTQNKMEVMDIYSFDNDLLYTSALATPENPFDPMEIAIKDYAFKNGLNSNGFYDNELIHEYIFNTENKMMGHVWKINNKNLLCVKGAYESVLPLCNIDKEEEKIVKDKIKLYSSNGYRIIAVASGEIKDIPSKLTDNHLHFCGLLALVDPPKPGVETSLKECYKAGIRVIMITGDNGETAKGIANQIGLKHNDNVITGRELENMSDEELQKRVIDTNIFARVYPNHKMRIVSALEKNGDVVAMTGDGINDAPALKKASIGIAMGKRGTNVAKEAADIILMDDNFNTIVKAIKNGRIIYNNIVKAVSYIVIIHIPIAFTALLVPLFNYPVLLLPIHVVIMELIIDPTSSIILERIKSTDDVMKNKPRKIDESLISKKSFIKSVIQGFAIFTVFFDSYIYLLNHNYSQAYATTVAFTTLILSNILLVNVIQSNKLAIKNLINNLKDKVILTIDLVILAGVLIFIYVPFMNKIVGTVPLTFKELLIPLVLSIIATFTFDLFKHKI